MQSRQQCVDWNGKALCQEHHERGMQQWVAPHSFRRFVVPAIIPVTRPEIRAVPQCLDRKKHSVEPEGAECDEVLLRQGESGSGCRHRVIRQNEAKNCKRDYHAEVGIGAQQVELLLHSDASRQAAGITPPSQRAKS